MRKVWRAESLATPRLDRKSTRLNSSHTVIYTLSLHDALPIFGTVFSGVDVEVGLTDDAVGIDEKGVARGKFGDAEIRSEEHTSELQSHSDLHSFPTRRSSDLRHCVFRR